MSKQLAKLEIEKLMKKVFPASIISQQGKEILSLCKQAEEMQQERINTLINEGFTEEMAEHQIFLHTLANIELSCHGYINDLVHVGYFNSSPDDLNKVLAIVTDSIREDFNE